MIKKGAIKTRSPSLSARSNSSFRHRNIILPILSCLVLLAIIGQQLLLGLPLLNNNSKEPRKPNELPAAAAAATTTRSSTVATKKKSVGDKCNHPRLNSFVHMDELVNPKNCTLGWSTPGSISSGQNLEDAVIFERFFSGYSPLAHLGKENGHGESVGGVFLEMGGLDGVTFSNTRMYEYCAGWDGILIEAQPDNTKLLFENRPCAVVIPEAACSVFNGEDKNSVDADGYSTISMSVGTGTAFDLSTRGEAEGGVEVPCRPLSAMLEEYGVTRINFFSLDVEGAELKVLETFNFDKVKIDVLMVEAEFFEAQGGVHANNAKIEAVRTLIETKSNMKRVPSRLDQGDTDKRLCERNGTTDNCMFFSIAGSDVFVSPELYDYDTKPWEYTG